MAPPEQLDEQQRAAWLKDKQFLQQLMDNTKVMLFQTQQSPHSCCQDIAAHALGYDCWLVDYMLFYTIADTSCGLKVA